MIENEPDLESLRFQAFELVISISLLRDDIRRNSGDKTAKDELIKKEGEIRNLCKSAFKESVQTVHFTLRDTIPADNPNGFEFCQRDVIVENLLASTGAQMKAKINLLPEGLDPASLPTQLPSFPLPLSEFGPL